MSRDEYSDQPGFRPFDADWLPMSVRVLDRLAPAIVGAADLLEYLGSEEGKPFRFVEPVVRAAYAELNDLMGRLAQ